MNDPRAGMPPLDAQAAEYLKPGEQIFCYACRAAGRCQMGITAVSPEGERALVADVICPENFEGGPRVAHGGWTASVLDEMLGSVALLHKRLTVTKSLAVEFVLPVPINQPLRGRSWNDRIEGHRWHNVGEVTLAATGAVLGRATGVFSERDPDHFQRHKAWLETQIGKAAD